MTDVTTERTEILIAGLGSAGHRHLANLRTLGWRDICLLRTGRATMSDGDLTGIAVESDLDRALARRPLAVIVSNPTALHMPVAVAAARAGAHLLIEKPISDRHDDVDELAALVEERGLVALVGFQFRFHPGLRQIKQWITEGAIGRVITAQAHWGEFLPDMHPWEDHRAGYAARADLGGGVLLTLCHPFDYLRWLVSEIDDVMALASNATVIDEFAGVDVDHCVDVLLRFETGASGHVHLNFVQRPTEHRLMVVGSHGTVTWSQVDHAAHLYSAGSREWHTVPAPANFERNTMFLDEMRHFLACLRGEDEPRCTLRDGVASLGVSLAARRSLAASADLVVAR